MEIFIEYSNTHRNRKLIISKQHYCNQREIRMGQASAPLSPSDFPLRILLMQITFAPKCAVLRTKFKCFLCKACTLWVKKQGTLLFPITLAHVELLTDFYLRDAMRMCGLCCRPMSVRLYVTLVDCIQTAEDIVKLLSRSSSPIILVFWPPAPISNSKWNFAIFDWNRRLSTKRYEIGPWLLWNVNSKL